MAFVGILTEIMGIYKTKKSQVCEINAIEEKKYIRFWYDTIIIEYIVGDIQYSIIIIRKTIWKLNTLRLEAGSIWHL